jgi:glycosyltransferase involved in cell wall biosynthesis
MRGVLWITHVYPRHEGDILGGFLHRLARELPARGFAPLVLAPGAAEAPDSETRDGVRVRRFRYAPPGCERIAYTGEMHRAALRAPIAFLQFARAFSRAASAAIEAEQPALVHAHWWVPTGVIAARALAGRDEPFVLSLHGTDVRLLGKARLLLPLARRVFRRAQEVLPVSSALAAKLEALGAPCSSTTILPMPADADVFTPQGEEREPGTFVVAARLTRQKRVDRALRALARALRDGADVRLHVAGDGPELSALRALAQRLGIADRVHFPGLLEPRRLAALFNRASGVVLPSEEEGYGLVLVEAALCEAPAIGVRSGGIAELIEPGVSGFLVEPHDERGLADAIAALARDPGRVAELGRQARSRALSRTAGPLADRLAELYRRLDSSARGA